jgi:hypothetical protein
MPVFVEWQWQERTKTFLVIFHLNDDFSTPNVRVNKYEIGRKEAQILTPIGEHTTLRAPEAWVTWAPSHVETGLLMEILSYANIVNGLKTKEKMELKPLLEVRRKAIGRCPVCKQLLPHICTHETGILRELVERDKKWVAYANKPEEDQEFSFCASLCPEYIGYIRELLKPYV